MKSLVSESLGKVVIISCERGDNIYSCITNALDKYNIVNAVVLSGVATFEQINYHYVKNCDILPIEEHVILNGPFEVSSMDGLIINKVPHIHFTASDQERFISAHLEPNTSTLYVAEIVIAEIKELGNIIREKDNNGINMIKIN